MTLYAVWKTGTGLDPVKPPVTDLSADIPVEENLSYVKTYTYDLNGNRTGFVITRGDEEIQSLGYEYDDLNRLKAVKNGNVTEAEYTYDVNGNRASLTYSNHTYITYSYNKANWVTNITNSRGSYPVSSFDYTYYLSGNQKTKTDIEGKTTEYVYDDLNRLISESDNDGLCLGYEYDASGNRISLTSTGDEKYSTEYVYDANNRLITETKSAGAEGSVTSYTYDANGNTLTKSVVDGENGISGTVYEYNLFGQQSKSTTNGKSVCYSYNAQGIRTAKATSTAYTSYYLDTANVAAEEKNGVITSYIRGINLIASISEDETSYYTFNAHGDVVGLMSSANEITKSYEYDAFGNEDNPSTEDDNPFRYCGEYYDTETGTYYLRARYYDPRIGRFTSEDTHWNTSNRIYGDNPQKISEREDALGLKTYSYAPQISAVVQSGNLYVYAVGNPVMYADEDGEMAKLVKAAIHGLLSGTISSMNTETDDFGDYAVNFVIGFTQGFVSDYFDLGVILVGLLSSVASAISLYFESDNTDTFVESLPINLLSGALEGIVGEVIDIEIGHFLYSAVTSGAPIALMEGVDRDYVDGIKTFFTEVISSLIDLGENEK